jgi:hypothetical protein
MWSSFKMVENLCNKFDAGRKHNRKMKCLEETLDDIATRIEANLLAV